jgi:hypothetical protein
MPADNCPPGALSDLADALRRVEETRVTADRLKRDLPRIESAWRNRRVVEIKGLPIPVPRKKALHPVGSEVEACVFNMKFAPGTEGDLPSLSEFQVEVRGLFAAGQSLFELQDHWRIDTDTFALRQGGSQHNEPHAFFHFQRGGYALDDFARQEAFLPGDVASLGDGCWKAIMLCPGPRIPALPFDPVLAIDFCISQNDGRVWRRLRNMPEYLQVVEASQVTYWLPFFESLASGAARQKWLGALTLV